MGMSRTNTTEHSPFEVFHFGIDDDRHIWIKISPPDIDCLIEGYHLGHGESCEVHAD